MHHDIDADEARKAVALTAMAENFGKTFSEELLGLWLDLLGEYSAAQVQQAVRSVIEHYEFKTIPPFAVLNKALGNITGSSEKARELQATAEWGVLLDRIDRDGYYSKPNLHPTTEYVLRMLGGWSDACQWGMKELDFKRRDFIRLWVDSHGREEAMQLGADAVIQALDQGSRPDAERGKAVHVGSAIGILTTGTVAQ